MQNKCIVIDVPLLSHLKNSPIITYFLQIICRLLTTNKRLDYYLKLIFIYFLKFNFKKDQAFIYASKQIDLIN